MTQTTIPQEQGQEREHITPNGVNGNSANGNGHHAKPEPRMLPVIPGQPVARLLHPRNLAGLELVMLLAATMTLMLVKWAIIMQELTP